MSVKIQIASLAALERLIGGDTDLEIEIRESVVQNFAKKHLKAIVDTDLLQKMEQALKEHINDVYFKIEKDGNYSFSKKVFKLNNKAKDAVDKYVSTAFEAQARKIIADKIMEFDKQVERLLARTTDYVETELQQQILNKKIEALVDQRLKEKLGIK